MKVLRQGDVLIRRVEGLPSEARPLGRDVANRIVLAHGEKTGHAHAIRDKNVCGFTTLPSGEIDYIEVGGSSPAVLNHELISGAQAEHKPIILEPGVYRIARQVEFNPLAERRVAD